MLSEKKIDFKMHWILTGCDSRKFSKIMMNCIYLALFSIPIACNASDGPPDYKQLEEQCDSRGRHIIILYVVIVLLLSILFLVWRISRTYKQSLMACEAQLEAFIIHSQQRQQNSPLRQLQSSAPNTVI